MPLSAGVLERARVPLDPLGLRGQPLRKRNSKLSSASHSARDRKPGLGSGTGTATGSSRAACLVFLSQGTAHPARPGASDRIRCCCMDCRSGVDLDRPPALVGGLIESVMGAQDPAQEGARLRGGVGFDGPLAALRGPIQFAVHLVAVGFWPELRRPLCASSDVTSELRQVLSRGGPTERARPDQDAHPDVGDVAPSLGRSLPFRSQQEVAHLHMPALPIESPDTVWGENGRP
jgi:hypothetical protein